MGSITDAVVKQHIVGRKIFMGARTGISSRQSTIVASISVFYPAILAGPKAGRESIQDFEAIKPFEQWDKGDSRHALVVTLTKSI